MDICFHFLALMSNAAINSCFLVSMSNSATPWTTTCQAFLSFTLSQSLLKRMSTESVMPSNHLILCCFLLLLPLFPSIRVFSNESALCIRWLKYCSFSFNISLFNDYSGLTISFLSNKLSRIFSSTTVQKHHFFGAQPSLWSNSHPYMTTGKTIALQADSLLSEPPGKPHKQLWTVFMQT